jgi:hypothetical protein
MVDDRLALLAQPDVKRPVMQHGGLEAGAHFQGIARAEHRHVGEHAQERDILERMMRGPEGGIGKSAANADDRRRHVVIA